MYTGFIKCPNCDSPLSGDEAVCPYCHSTAPMSAPWRPQWSPLVVAIISAVVVVVGILDMTAGTEIIKSTFQWLQANGQNS